MRLELTTSGFDNQMPSLTAGKARTQRESSLSRCCTVSLLFYHIASVIDLSSEKYICSTGHKNCWYMRNEFSEDA